MKNALVTGCSSGFGRLAAQSIAQEGHRVFASMRDIEGRNARASADLHKWAQGHNLWIQVMELDVTDDESVARAIAQITSTVDHLDVVVNNAGIAAFGFVEAYTTAQLRRLFDVNVLGAHRVNLAVLPHMRKQQSGLIIHVSSVSGRLIFPFMGPYNASKFALEGLAESLRYEVAPLGIDSVIVEPGPYPTTNAATNLMPPENKNCVIAYGGLGKRAQDFMERFDAPHIPNPQEVADVIVRLIKLPPGKRPARTTVGVGVEGVEAINRTGAEVQARLMELLGFKDLLSVAGGAEAE